MTIETLGYVTWAALGTAWFVADGAALGRGLLLPVLARDRDERRAVSATLGSRWIAPIACLAGWVAFTLAAFPPAFATLATVLFTPLVAWGGALAVRGIGCAYRDLEDDPNWRSAADLGIAAGSVVATVATGVLFANMCRGLLFLVPLRAEENDAVRDLLDPYALLGGALVLLLCAAAGAASLAARTGGRDRLEHRARGAARATGALALVAFAGFAALSTGTTPLGDAPRDHPVVWILPALTVAALVVCVLGHGAHPRTALIALAAAAASGFATLYPRFAWSRRDPDPAATITAFSAAAPADVVARAVVIALLGLVGIGVWVWARRSRTRADVPPRTAQRLDGSKQA